MSYQKGGKVSDVERDQMISPAELQQWLGCGRSTIYKLLDEGAIRSYRVGRLIRIDPQDVVAYLRENPYRPDAQ